MVHPSTYMYKLVHERFLKDAALSCATATAIALSPCGNFAFIGYSTGHVDQFNVQSGLFIKTFTKGAQIEEKMTKKEKAKLEKAHESRITALTVNSRGSELITGCSKGSLKFWQVRSGQLLATMRTRLRIERSAPCTSNSLLAIACAGDEGASVAVVDTLCRRVVRTFLSVGHSVNALTFSSDGRWLLTADDKKYIRVWELSTSQLIDVMLFDKPCISMSFNSSGEYLATVHKGEKAIFVWVNKNMYATHVNIRALPLDYVPTWADSCVAEMGVKTFVIDDESDDEETDSVLKTRKDFELVQAYMATAIKIHRSSLWKNEGQSKETDELLKVLEELSVEEEHVWSDYDQVMVQNAAVAQWVKNALL
ncbi:WD domain, G-beta repeat protein [Ostertagia ostertagi]